MSALFEDENSYLTRELLWVMTNTRWYFYNNFECGDLDLYLYYGGQIYIVIFALINIMQRGFYKHTFT
jgi:hypothetical protein